MDSLAVNFPIWALPPLFVILFSEAVWLFRDAHKQGANPWLWGLWALTNFPTPLVVYLIVVRKVFRRKNKS
jgi:hypothetical protein